MAKIRIDQGKGIHTQLQLGCNSAEDAIDGAQGAAEEALHEIGNDEVYLHPVATGEAQCADCGLCFRVHVAPSGEPTEISSVEIYPFGSEDEYFVTVYAGRPQVTSVELPGNFRQVCQRHKEG